VVGARYPERGGSCGDSAANVRRTRGDLAQTAERVRHGVRSICRYREQIPPRAISQVALALGRGKRVLEAWSSRHNWVERANAYTDHLDRLAIAVHEDEIVRRRREENEQVFELARELRLIAASRIVGVVDEDGKTVVAPIDPNTRCLSRQSVDRYVGHAGAASQQPWLQTQTASVQRAGSPPILP
jgi:hypothetical protein